MGQNVGNDDVYISDWLIFCLYRAKLIELLQT